MSEKKNRTYGILATLLFHGAMLLVLLTLALRTPLPLPGEEGMEVNLGFSDEGLGDIQPTDIPAGNQASAPPPKASKDEEVVTDDDEEAPNLTPKKQPKPKTETVTPSKTNRPSESKPAEPVLNPNALYRGKQQGQGQPSSQGITQGTGDQGRADGNPNSNNYSGQGGAGNGPGFYLSGRSKVFLFQPSYNSDDQGTVVVEIVVDRDGNVIRAIPGKKIPGMNIGTTTSDQTLWNEARNAALKSKFSPNPKADPEQKGYIVYRFIKMD
ncbi:MAG: hypothetical protein HPY80_12710 [Bacteroidales bacterium]|nr:hypothetical protein [Bacteroidales bacterium]NPV37515.1 hypothetical protein [Bacteroidales bacterium]